MAARFRLLLFLATAIVLAPWTSVAADPVLKPGDLIALAGGEDMVAAAEEGSLELALLRAVPEDHLRVRSLAWEGDTVFEQRRDLNYPPLEQQLDKLGATVVIAQFGKMESLAGRDALPAFTAAYAKLLDRLSGGGKRRLIVVSPSLFEPNSFRPTLPAANEALSAYAASARELALEKGGISVDLANLQKSLPGIPLTRDGVHLEDGLQASALAIVQGCGLPSKPFLLTLGTDERDFFGTTRWNEVKGEAVLRSAIKAKNRLWFHYYRPQNWAFLAGDCTNQPSSRDYLDPTKRWFPAEMEQWLPLITARDGEIDELAARFPEHDFIKEPPEPPAPPASPVSRAPDKDDPAAELASFKLPEGFEAQLFASEKDGVVKPVQIRWDSRGRLWVIGTQTYPQIKPGEQPNDKVLILEDPGHTGHVQRVSVFADGLMIPTGLELDGDAKGCYLGEGTKLWHFRDDENTGHALRREIVLRGFGTGDNHQNLNSFLWSPGGELMFSQGLHGFARVETPWGISRLDQAGLWRLRLKELRLDSFWGGSAEPQNPWGWAFTDWGQPIVVAGNNGGVFSPLPEMIPGHDDRRAGNIWVNARGRKSSGPDIVGTAHLPPEWQGVLLTGGYINNAVWSMKIEDDGAGFRVTDLPPLITSTHGSFRPVDVKIGPDGAIYIADWYNPIIGHYQASFRHPDRDKVHGRIWRITYKGRPFVEQPPLDAAPPEQLFEALKSPERWTRFQAKRVLVSRGDEITAALRAWCEHLDPNDSGTEHALVEALGVFESREAVEPALLSRLLEAKHPDARAYAAGTVARWAGRLPAGFDAESALSDLAHDENPRVRLAAIVAAGNIQSSESIIVALSAAEEPRDRFIDSALREAIVALKPHWLQAVRKAGNCWKPQWVETLVRLDATPDTSSLVRELLSGGSHPAATRAALAQIFVETGAVGDLPWFFDPSNFTVDGAYQPALHAKILAGLRSANVWRNPPLNDQNRSALEALAGSPSEEVRAEATRLAGFWHQQQDRAKMRELVLSAAAPAAVRIAAIDALGFLGGREDQEFLAHFIQGENVPEAGPGSVGAAAHGIALQLAAIHALSLGDLAGAAKAGADLLGGLETANIPGLLRIFFERSGGPEALSQALASASLPASTAREVLHAARLGGFQNAALSKALEAAAGQHVSHRAAPEIVAALAKEVLAKGDAVRGNAVFHRADAGCTACHSVAGQGGNIGPSLDAIGSGQPLDFIIGAVLEPQKEVKEGYEAIQVTTKDGQTLQGYRAREDAVELTLRDVAQQLKEVRIPKERIAGTREIGSLMPDGLIEHLSLQEQYDLFRYLSELGKPAGVAK